MLTDLIEVSPTKPNYKNEKQNVLAKVLVGFPAAFKNIFNSLEWAEKTKFGEPIAVDREEGTYEGNIFTGKYIYEKRTYTLFDLVEKDAVAAEYFYELPSFANDDQDALNKKLLNASVNGNELLARGLLLKNANPNQALWFMEGELYHVGSALFAATVNRHVRIVRLLCEHGADVNQSSDSYLSPIHFAMKNLALEILPILQKYDPETAKIFK